MAGKRKAEGIALLSLYNDEETDEEEDEDGDEQEEEAKEEELAEVRGDEEEGKDVHEGKDEDEVGKQDAEIVESQTIPASAVSETQSMLETVRSSEDIVLGNGPHGIIVDYAHDEIADEEGENMNTGRAVFGMAVHISNGFVQGTTSPGGLISTPQNGRLDDEVDDSKLPTDTDQTAVAATLEIVDIEMSAIVDADKNATPESDLLADFLPPPSTEKCSNELQQKFAKYLVLKNAGRSFNEELRKSKGYRNPDFLQRAVKYQEIDQIGSCFKKEIFDPHGYDPSDFYDALASDFKRELERKEQAKKQSQRVDFVHGGVQTAQIPTLPDKTKLALPISTGQKGIATAASQVIAPSSETVVKSDSGRSNKKSKWDKVDSDARGPALPPVGKPAMGAHTALLTANAGGNYASFIQQKRKDVEERSRSSDKKSDRR